MGECVGAMCMQTDVCRFRGGYRNRRINLTFLYGRRKADELAL